MLRVRILIRYLTSLFKIVNEKVEKIPNSSKNLRYKKLMQDFENLKKKFEEINSKYKE
jgi:hypothetical protein